MDQDNYVLTLLVPAAGCHALPHPSLPSATVTWEMCMGRPHAWMVNKSWKKEEEEGGKNKHPPATAVGSLYSWTNARQARWATFPHHLATGCSSNPPHRTIQNAPHTPPCLPGWLPAGRWAVPPPHLPSTPLVHTAGLPPHTLPTAHIPAVHTRCS